MADTVYNLPIVRSVEDCKREFPDMVVISKLMKSYDTYDDFYYHLYYVICACAEIDECIRYKIKFKFYPDSEKSYELSMPKMLLNMNAWRPLIELNELQKYYRNQLEVLDESYIIGIMMSDSLRTALETKVLQTLNDYGIPFERTSELLKVMIERYQEASIEFAMINQASIMTFESIFLNDYRNSEKIRELNNLEIPQSMQTADVEIYLKKRYNELIDAMSATKNPIWYVSKAGSHIKPKQVQELFISYGQIPDVSGNVIPYTMQGNGFSTGYVDPTSYYVASTGARLSAIINKSKMGESGYLSRNLILLSRTLTLSNTVYDCGTKHLLPVTVTDSDFLHRLENKWYCEHEGEPLQVLHYEDCKDLIGKKIYIRSLVTCALGDEVCHVCYGKDSDLVMNMPGMAIFNTEVYSEPVSQNILSTKHLLFTAANRIGFSKSFDTYFRYSAGDIYLKDKDELEHLPIGKLSIRIEEGNVIPVNQQDMQEYNSFGDNIESPFYVYNSATKEYDKIEIINYESMFIDATSMKLFKVVSDRHEGKSYYEISFDDLSNELEGRLMSIDIKNHGLTDNLYSIMDLLNKRATQYEGDYAALAQDFFDILIRAGIRARHVQAEVILNRLIRDANDLYHRPDFSKFENPPVKILSLNQALLKTQAPTVGFSYQELKRQLLSDELYEQKDGSSYLDPMYASKVSTKHLKQLAQKVKEKRLKEQNESKEASGVSSESETLSGESKQSS